MKGGWGGIRRLFTLGLWGPEVEEGVDWEIEHHIQERADELEAAGLSRSEAESEARRRFGDVEAIRRELSMEGRSVERQRRLGLWLETVWQDLRYGLRAARRGPTFAATLVLTLGLGIGAVVAVFGIVDALLLRPLPYEDPGELVRVEVQYGAGGWRTGWLPEGVVWAWRAADAGFEAVLPNRRASVLYTDGEPKELTAQRVGTGFEEVLGVTPVLGRGFGPEDGAPGAPPVALVSYGFWRSELGADSGAVGGTIRLDHTPHTVLGVMPAGFKFPEYSTTDVWLPLAEGAESSAGRLELLARVSPAGLPAEESRAGAYGARLVAEQEGRDSAKVLLLPIEEQRGGGASLRRGVWLLVGAVGLILLVALVNGANLLLVRGANRAREVAVRLAVGASRVRVVRQLLTEAVALSMAAGLVAIAVGWLSLRAVGELVPVELAFWLPHDIGMEGRVLGFAFATAVVAGVLLGVVPALRNTRTARATAREGLTPYAAHSPTRSRLRRGLVVAEVALSVLLLAGAGLLLHSFARLVAVDPGVRTEGLALAQIPVSARSQPDSAARATFVHRLEQRIEALPGVRGATVAASLPAGQLRVGVELQVEGREPAGGDPDILPSAAVRPDFFDVVGARLLAGRSFRSSDDPGSVAIIDEDMARHLWPDGDAVGARFRTSARAEWRTVVGVMADMQLARRDDAWGDFEMLELLRPGAAEGEITLAVRTAGDPTALFPAIRGAVRQVAPDQPVRELTTAEAAYGETLQLPRFLTVLVTAVAAFALLLAAIGLFGVLAYEVAARRRELGIRTSMGATAGELRRMVLRDGVALAAAGAALGLAGSLALGRFVETLLYDLEPGDPATLIAVVATMLLTAAIASYLPARRATRIDPAEVLRVE